MLAAEVVSTEGLKGASESSCFSFFGVSIAAFQSATGTAAKSKRLAGVNFWLRNTAAPQKYFVGAVTCTD